MRREIKEIQGQRTNIDDRPATENLTFLIGTVHETSGFTWLISVFIVTISLDFFNDVVKGVRMNGVLQRTVHLVPGEGHRSMNIVCMNYSTDHLAISVV